MENKVLYVIVVYICYLFARDQIRSGAQPSCYLMDTWASFLRVKVAAHNPSLSITRQYVVLSLVSSFSNAENI